MSARSAILPDIIADARGWLGDCFPALPTLCTGEVLGAIERHYVGGVRQFVADGNYEDVSA